MVSMISLSMVDHGFEPRLGQIKDYKIGYLVASPQSTQQ
jgi:hypothetical protein